MPATEETLRNQKFMHLVFGVSGSVMLLATIWMFAADHSREWKTYQRTGRRITKDLTKWEAIQFQTEQAVARTEKLHDGLAAVRMQPIDRDEYATLKNRIEAQNEDFDFTSIDRVYDQFEKALTAADPQALDERESVLGSRQELISGLRAIVNQAKAKEKEFLRLRKFTNADYDAAKATLGIGIRDGLDSIQALQEKVDVIKKEVDKKTEVYEEANAYRLNIQNAVDDMLATETEAESALKQSQTDLERLKTATGEITVSYFEQGFPWLGKKWLELPVLDAFNSPLEIDNHHYPHLTVDYNFKRVARFDRCTTCHRAIDKASVDDTRKPAFLSEREVTITLDTPESRPATDQKESLASHLLRTYGIQLADRGLVDRNDVTVSFVRPSSLAALAVTRNRRETKQVTGLELRQAVFRECASPSEHTPRNGLKVGDVILSVNDNKVLEGRQLMRFLLESTEWGKPVQVKVRRGLPQPYASHPRLDLFVGASSPHPLQDFGCTSCHEGQGSATAFKWASHTPTDLEQRQQWRLDHGWFNNHHWIFPMYSQRFAEASCIRCHHDVTDLEASERFPDPPAPKVVAGHKLVSAYGCFGCHEINGYDGPDKRIGPDLRLEPNFFAAALQLLHVTNERMDHFQNQQDTQQASAAEQRLSELTEIAELARQVAEDSEHNHAARHRLIELLTADASRPADDGLGTSLPPTSLNLARALKDVGAPGRLRKVGPSLRHVGHKLDPEFLYDWIREPKHFRPETKMPQFFGLREHLLSTDGLSDNFEDKSEVFEPIELHGIVSYLLDRTQSFESTDPPPYISPSETDEKIKRGKLLFETRGCLACHSHKDFPNVHATQNESSPTHLVHAPDLSAIGNKLSAPRNENGKQWLYSWLRDPSNYHVRTRMPNMFLEPIETRDAKGNVVKVTDPAADIAEYLLNSRSNWKPVAKASQRPSAVALKQLVLEHLRKVFHKRSADEYFEKGIPEEMRGELKGAEVELVGEPSEKKRLLYIGNKAIAKYGCYACHDIPGFEEAKPIGTGLADWGRKDPSKLDFAHIAHYLHEENHHFQKSAQGSHGTHQHGSEDHQPDHSEPLEPYFQRLINEHDRAGFAMQKLRQPRSYDFKNVDNKGYNERLRMPQFPLSSTQREAIVTFVLGLIAEPPVDTYVHRPPDRIKAIVEGRQVLEKYNCGGCHVLEPDRWALDFRADDFETPAATKTFPFLLTHFNSEQLAKSEETNRRDRMQALIAGAPTVSNDDGLPVVLDDEGDEVDDDEEYDPNSVTYSFDLWKPALMAGSVFEVGASLEIPKALIDRKYAASGGHFTRYLLPRVVELERAVNPSAKGTEAWGWLPPPLFGQGHKVQSGWLHDFLLDPHPIRPAVFLRMPRFNMSSDEATKLVNYFAAMDHTDYPYQFDPRTRSGYVTAAEQLFRERLQEAGIPEPDPDKLARFDHAMRIVTDNKNYCTQCHLVGDPSKGGYEPTGPERAKGPDLAAVARRLRPQFVRRWIADPDLILPYTSMPSNITYDATAPHLGGVSQDLFPGNSIEQLDALVDLLMNYDEFSNSRSPIAPLIKTTAPTAAVPAEETAER